MTADRNQEAGAAYSHRSVLLDSAVDYLVNDPDGYYVDGTFGRVTAA
jgi:16S rRNA (cytosine1402-N4)-methyltransferase